MRDRRCNKKTDTLSEARFDLILSPINVRAAGD